MFTNEMALEYLLARLNNGAIVPGEFKKYSINGKVVINNIHMMLYLPTHSWRKTSAKGVFFILDKSTYRVKSCKLTVVELKQAMDAITNPPSNWSPSPAFNDVGSKRFEENFFKMIATDIVDVEKYQWFLSRHPEFVYQRLGLEPSYYYSGVTIKFTAGGVTIDGQTTPFVKFYNKYVGTNPEKHEIEQYNVYAAAGHYETSAFFIKVDKLNLHWFNKVNLTHGKWGCKNSGELYTLLSDLLTLDSVAPLTTQVKPKYDLPKEIIHHITTHNGGMCLLNRRMGIEQLVEALDLMVGYKLKRNKSSGDLVASVPGFQITFDVDTGWIRMSKSSLANVKISIIDGVKTIEWATDKHTRYPCGSSGKFINALKLLHKQLLIEE